MTDKSEIREVLSEALQTMKGTPALRHTSSTLPLASRSDFVAVAEELGLNRATASTQFSKGRNSSTAAPKKETKLQPQKPASGKNAFRCKSCGELTAVDPDHADAFGAIHTHCDHCGIEIIATPIHRG